MVEKKKKKLFVSVPMKDRTSEAIKNSIVKMHKIAEVVLDEELELIDNFKEEKPLTNADTVRCLGESLIKMANANYVIGLAEIDNNSGCLIEREVALRYNIPYIRAFAEQVAPDIIMSLQMASRAQQHKDETTLNEMV